jgi:hypothetical protein
MRPPLEGQIPASKGLFCDVCLGIYKHESVCSSGKRTRMSFRQARRCLTQRTKLQKQITLRQEPSCANDRQRNSYQAMMFAQQKDLEINNHLLAL